MRVVIHRPKASAQSAPEIQAAPRERRAARVQSEEPSMRLKSYFAPSVEAALSEGRQELGPDAMIVQSRRAPPELQHLGAYEAGTDGRCHRRRDRTPCAGPHRIAREAAGSWRSAAARAGIRRTPPPAGADAPFAFAFCGGPAAVARAVF